MFLPEEKTKSSCAMQLLFFTLYQTQVNTVKMKTQNPGRSNNESPAPKTMQGFLIS
jgi:hypothetical protein